MRTVPDLSELSVLKVVGRRESGMLYGGAHTELDLETGPWSPGR